MINWGTRGNFIRVSIFSLNNKNLKAVFFGLGLKVTNQNLYYLQYILSH